MTNVQNIKYTMEKGMIRHYPTKSEYNMDVVYKMTKIYTYIYIYRKLIIL